MATNIFTLEGVIENGQIRFPSQVHLPEGARVFIIVPDMHIQQQARIYSPRLKNPEQSRDFELEVSAENNNGGV